MPSKKFAQSQLRPASNMSWIWHGYRALQRRSWRIKYRSPQELLWNIIYHHFLARTITFWGPIYEAVQIIHKNPPFGFVWKKGTPSLEWFFKSPFPPFIHSRLTGCAGCRKTVRSRSKSSWSVRPSCDAKGIETWGRRVTDLGSFKDKFKGCV